MIHQLKIMPEYFEAVISGKKTFELRVNDRDYKAGDYLALNEYDQENKAYTRRSCLVYVDYIMDQNTAAGVPALKDNIVVMSIKPVKLKTVFPAAPQVIRGCERIERSNQ